MYSSYKLCETKMTCFVHTVPTTTRAGAITTGSGTTKITTHGMCQDHFYFIPIIFLFFYFRRHRHEKYT